MKRNWAFLAITFMVTLMAGCSNTKLVKSWRAADLGDLDQVMTFALTANTVNRATMESALVSELETIGIRASSSVDHFGPGFDSSKKNRDEIVTRVSKHADYAMVTTLLAVDTNDRYVEGQTYYVPRRIHYRPFGRVYTGVYGVVHEPGYYQEDTRYRVETNLYRLSDQQLIWSAVTTTANPSTIESGTRGIARTVARQLNQDR